MIVSSFSTMSQIDMIQCKEELDDICSESNSKAITLVFINTEDCSNCMKSLDKILKADEAGLISYLHYILVGLQDGEVDYYFQNVLDRKATDFSILQNSQCSYGFNSSEQSKVLVIKDGDVIFEKIVKNIDFDEIPFQKPKRIQLKLVDSSEIEMKNDFLLKGGVFRILDSPNLLCLNTKYQELLLINLKTNEVSKVLKSKDIPIDFKKILTSEFKNSLTGAINGTKLSEGLLKNFELTNLSVSQKGTVYLSGKIRYEQNLDSMQNIMNLPVIIEANSELDSFNTYTIGGLKERGYTFFADHFYINDDVAFFKVFKQGDKSLKERYHSVVKMVKKEDEFQFSEFSLELPEYFYTNELLYNFSTGKFYRYEDSIVYIYDVFPKIFNITQKNNTLYLPSHEHNQSVYNFEDGIYDISYFTLNFHKYKGYSCLISKDKKNGISSTQIEIWNDNDSKNPYFLKEVLFVDDNPINYSVGAFSRNGKFIIIRNENNKYKIYYFEIDVF